uniref:Organic cation transporter protein n=1 Tax=Cacopsylla melanoneura TaxID=428564 RepID=A0A8D8S4C5_9HEMI
MPTNQTSNPNNTTKMSLAKDEPNLEGSQNPVYKITRLKSEVWNDPAAIEKLHTTENSPKLNEIFVKDIDNVNDQLSETEVKLKESNKDVGRRTRESKEKTRCDDPVREIVETDVTNEDIDKNIPGQGNDIVEDASLNVDSHMPEPPVKMTYILPKEVNMFKMDDKENGNSSPGSGGDIDFDDVLPHLGEFGRYQKMLFLAMIPFAFSVSFVYFAQIFIAVIPEHYWCRVPELAHLDPEQRRILSIPHKGGSFDSCIMYAVNYSALIATGVTQADPTWPTSECQYGWEYDFTDVPYSSIATEHNWVCQQDTLPTLATAIFFCGAIVGGLLFGWMADHFGRIPALIGTNLTGFIAGVATAFATNFWQFAACRFFVGLAFDNCFTMMYILVLEYVGPTWRTFVANMSIALFFSVSATLLPWIAYYTANWQYLCILTSLPLLVAVFVPWIVPESARWLVSQGRVDEAVVIMKKFEKINKKTVDPKLYQQLKDTCLRQAQQEKESKKYSVLDLFKTPRLRKTTFLFIIIWMAVSLLFDGHVRQVGNLGLDLFITFTIASATELPADTLLTFTLDVWGRRWYACGSMVFSGLFSLLSSSTDPGKLSAGLAIMGRFLANISYNIGLQYAAEVLPTVVRAQGVAFIHIMGYVASILSPFIVYLNVISTKLPLIVLGIIGILGGILCLFLPETLGEDLPQTLQDGEDFGKDQKFLEFPCCGKKSEDDPEIKPESTFKRSHQGVSRSSGRSSMRASVRGEQYRSSLIHRTFQKTDLGY